MVTGCEQACQRHHQYSNHHRNDASSATTRSSASFFNEEFTGLRYLTEFGLTGWSDGHWPPFLGNTYDTILSSSMQISKVNKSEPVALHDQVVAEIRRAIADGEAVQGERLPPAVDLATVLGVNKNTVIRALHILRDEGLLDFTRGRGVRVVGTPQRGAVMTRIDELIAFARTQGYRQEEVVALIRARS
jgi:GntR family transcriptional regulator